LIGVAMGMIIDFIKLPDEEAMISRLLVYLKKRNC